MDYSEFCSVNEKNKITVGSISKQQNAIFLTDGRTVSLQQVLNYKGFLSNPSALYSFGEDVEKQLKAGLFDKHSFTIDSIATNKAGEKVVNIIINGSKNVKATLKPDEVLDAVYNKRKYLTNAALIRPLFEAVEKAKAESDVDPNFRNCVISMLKHCVETQHAELPAKLELDPNDQNKVVFYAKVTEDFKSKINRANDEQKTNILKSILEMRIDNTIEVKVMSKNDRKALYEFIVPFKNASDRTKFEVNQSIEFIQQNYKIFMGLCGYIAQYNIQTCFSNSAPFSNEDYQGIRDYTMTSGATNRMLRGIEMDAGEEIAGALRNIRRCDSFFNKVMLNRPITVFRGEACGDDSYLYKRMREQGKGFTNVDGFMGLDSAYMSTSLNLTSAVYFAGNCTNRGIIYVIDLPAGLRAGYTHNIAGWVEQFEITIDRYIDIIIDHSIIKFKDSAGTSYNIVRAHLDIHTPMSPITKQSMINKGKTMYDAYGRIPFDEEYADNMIHEAYQLLTNKGVDVQYQKEGKMHMIDTNKYYDYPSMVVARLKNPDTETVTDLGFSLGNAGVEVRKIRTKVKACGRQDYAKAKGLHWQEYGLGYSFVDNKFKSNTEDNIDLDSLYKCRLLTIDGDITAKTVALRIYNYLKFQKNAAMFPILDIARYFDLCMAQIITSEGYELHNSIRVDRHVDAQHEGDSQAGFVPCQYVINGDNDDHLTIRIKFERERGTNKLLLSYGGRSDRTVLSETKKLLFSVFNNDSMAKVCMTILYEFEKKMKLSRTRKIDRLIDFFCSQTRCLAVQDRSEEAKAINGHYISKNADGSIDLGNKGYNDPNGLSAVKTYKIWNVSRTAFFSIRVSKNDSDNFTLQARAVDNRTKEITLDRAINIDTRYPIHQCYRVLVDGLMSDTETIKYDEL